MNKEFIPILLFRSLGEQLGDYNYKVVNIKKKIKGNNFYKNYFPFLVYNSYAIFDKYFLNILSHKRLLNYLKNTKLNFICFYYNKNLYNFNRLIKLIKNYQFKLNSIVYYLILKENLLKFMNIIIYLKKKQCLL